MRIFLLIFSLMASGVFADADFNAANKLYESGKYTESAAAYNTIIGDGNQSAEVYYNLGNSYFKEKKLGLAILSYEKALKISPRDPDIKYNLDFARSFIKETAVADAASKFLSSLYNYLTLNELCVILSVVFFLLMALVIYRRFKKD